jgi:hypothetical protein
MCARMIALYIVGLSMKTLRNALFVDSSNAIVEMNSVMMRTAIEEKAGLKGILVLSYHSSFVALVWKQKGVKIVAMTQIKT